VAYLWQFYDRPGDSYIHNAEKRGANGKEIPIRKCHNVNGAIVNPKYPFLSCNLDRQALKGSHVLNENAVLVEDTYDEGFPVECKKINGFVAKKWEDGVPRGYVYQTQQQMIVTDTHYSEIALFIDGIKLKVLPIHRDPILCQEILDKGSDFWNLVEIGRKWYKLHLEALSIGDQERANECLAKVYEYEPEPDDNPAYAAYLSERHEAKDESMKGDEPLNSLALQHKRVDALIKALGEVKEGLGNKLRYACVQNQVDRIEHSSGYTRLYMRKNGKTKTLDNKVPGPDELELKLMKEQVLKDTKIEIDGVD
jgi:hypothetical protein